MTSTTLRSDKKPRTASRQMKLNAARKRQGQPYAAPGRKRQGVGTVVSIAIKPPVADAARKRQGEVAVVSIAGKPPAADAARKRQAERALAAMDALAAAIDTGGRKFTREEMNERHAAGNTPAADAGQSPENRRNCDLYQEPVDYDCLEECLDELDLSPTRHETMEEQHLRQAKEMLRFLEFERNLDERQLRLSDRERHLLFLKEEGRRDVEQRRLYLLFLRYERQHLEREREA